MIGDLWYKNAIVYSLDVETFLDANGDGCGDFEGLTRRLDYLEGLGVTALWLAPFQPSPRRDDGYDITDYYGVDRTLRLRRRLRRIHARGGQPRHPRHHRPRREPHLRPASLVRGARAPRRAHATGTCGRRSGRRTGDRHRLPRRADATTWTLRHAGRRVLLPPLLRLRARSQHGQPARARGTAAHHGLLAAAGRRRVPRRRRAVRAREAVAWTAGRRDRLRLLHQIREMLQWRRGDAVLLGEANVPPAETQPYFAGGRRPAHDVQLLGQPAPVRSHSPPAMRGRSARALRADADAAATARNGPTSCATTTSSTSAASTSVERRQVFDGVRPRAVDAALRPRHPPPARADARRPPTRSNSPTACCSRCPARRCCAMATRSAWARTCACEERMAIRTPMQWSDEPNGGFTTAQAPVRPSIQRGPMPTSNVNVEAAAA